VGVFQDQQQRPPVGDVLKHPDQQVVGVVGPRLSRHRRRELILRPIQRQHRVEERRQTRERQPIVVREGRVRLQARQDVRPTCGRVVRERIQPEVLAEDRTPGVVGGRLVDRIARADQARHTCLAPPLEQVLDQSRLADPGLPLDQHHAAGARARQGLQAVPQHGPLGLPPNHRGVPAGDPRRVPRRAIDHDGFRAALHPKAGQRVERQERPGRLIRRRVAEDRVGRGLHQPRGQVHDVPDHGVPAPRIAADQATERLSPGDADSAPHPQPSEGGLHGPGRLDGARGVAFVRLRRQAEYRDECHALVVDEQLQDAALVATDDRLDRPHDPVSPRRRARHRQIQVEEIDEQRRDPPQLGQPLGAFGI
jgi:hypothetical protein